MVDYSTDNRLNQVTLYVKLIQVPTRAAIARLHMSRAHLRAQVYAAIAQLVERIHGKDEVSGSIPGRGSMVK